MYRVAELSTLVLAVSAIPALLVAGLVFVTNF